MPNRTRTTRKLKSLSQPGPRCKTATRTCARKHKKRLSRKRDGRKGKRKRVGPTNKRKFIEKPSTVRCMDNALQIPAKQFRPTVQQPPVRFEELRRIPQQEFGLEFFKVGFYNQRKLQRKRGGDSFTACFNKLCKLFGPAMARNKRFRYILGLLVITGFNARDFRSLIRIDDLYVRNCHKAFHTAMGLFIKSIPSLAHRKLGQLWSKEDLDTDSASDFSDDFIDPRVIPTRIRPAPRR